MHNHRGCPCNCVVVMIKHIHVLCIFMLVLALVLVLVRVDAGTGTGTRTVAVATVDQEQRPLILMPCSRCGEGAVCSTVGLFPPTAYLRALYPHAITDAEGCLTVHLCYKCSLAEELARTAVELRARVGWQPSVASLYLDRLATVSVQLLAALAAGSSASTDGPAGEAFRVSRVRWALQASASPLSEGWSRHTPADSEGEALGAPDRT
jgi:hypothetical protein